MSLAERRRAEGFLRRSDPNRYVSWRLTVGGRDLRDLRRLRSLTRTENDSGGAAVGIEAQVAGKLPRAVEYEDVRLEMRIGDVERIRRFTGEAELPEVTGGASILRAHTAGYWLDKIKLNAYTIYTDQQPEVVTHDLLTRAPYDKSRLEIFPAAVPKFQADPREAGNTGYQPFQAIGEPLADITVEARYAFRDTPWNGCIARVPPAKPQNPEWEFDLGPGELVEGEPESVQEGRFSHVVVFRPHPVTTGKIQYLTNPIRVPGTRAPDDAWLYIEVSDASQAAADAALLRAREEVDRMTGMRRRGEWVARHINPYLTRGSAVTVVQRDWDDDGAFTRHWVGELTGVVDDFLTMTQSFSAEMYLLEETRVPAPRPRPKRATYALRMPRLGLDARGRFRVDPELPFITVVNESMLGVDVNLAAPLGVRVVGFPSDGMATLENYPALAARGVVLAGDERTVDQIGDATIEEIS